MAKRLFSIRSSGSLMFSLVLFSGVGCAFPYGSTQGDPLLGNFHRPFVPTPPPERGGIPMNSPAYDAGARIGLYSPDVPTAIENSNGFMTLPSLTSPNLFSGARLPFVNEANDAFARQQTPRLGARLPVTGDGGIPTPQLAQAWMPGLTRSSVAARPHNGTSMITSGASIDPYRSASDIRAVTYKSMREATKVNSAEEGQHLLQSMGAQRQRMEQVETGEWVFTCAYGTRSYEARGRERLDAMRTVIDQILQDQ